MTDQPTNTAAVKALCKAQAEMTSAKKGSDNPHFRSKYADLAAVQAATYPALHKNGFAIMQPVGRVDGEWITTTIFAHESGATFECPVPLIVDKSQMQAFKSANSYARRIGLENLSGCACEDDDGNSAAANPPKGRDNGSRVIDNTPPPPKDQFRATNPSDDDKEATRVISIMGTISDMDEFKAFWDSLVDSQPRIAKRNDVFAAKSDRKAVIGGGKGAV